MSDTCYLHNRIQLAITSKSFSRSLLRRRFVERFAHCAHFDFDKNFGGNCVLQLWQNVVERSESDHPNTIRSYQTQHGVVICAYSWQWGAGTCDRMETGAGQTLCSEVPVLPC